MNGSRLMLTNPLIEHYRISDDAAGFELLGERSAAPGYFRFGESAIGYGRTCSASSEAPDGHLENLLLAAEARDSKCWLPFDPADVVSNLRHERYAHGAKVASGKRSVWNKAYYAVRPLLPFALRARMKRIVHRGWERKSFPSWPVDHSVESMMEGLLSLSMRASGVDRLPFIWFWPRQHAACVVMTHDVETQAGLDFCDQLMDLNDTYGVKSSMQLVPEERYKVSSAVLQGIQQRGHEVNVHDWNHDGLLFSDRQLFLERVSKINRAAKEFGAEGFRSGALYRNLDWYDRFEFAYDMSVPNVAHLDPQTGGCCTVMPYFVGDILELPVTMVQDYMLFHLLGDYSIDLWKRQLSTIRRHHGMASFIVHPDYIIEKSARRTYTELLGCLTHLRDEENVWIAPPGEVNRWWRARSQMRLVRTNGHWEIEGSGKEDACVAWAELEGDGISYRLENVTAAAS